MIYVTHDQIEAMTLADRIAIMKGGLIQQLADPHTIYTKPVNRYVAGFIGSPSINFLEGTMTGGKNATFSADGISIPLAGYEFSGNGAADGSVSFGIRPEHIVVGEQADNMPFSQDVTIDVVEPMGSDTLVWSTLGGQDFRFRVDGQSMLRAGQSERIGFDPARASIFDTKSELRV